jgi:predicted RNA-binding protein YlqC (UPF0109 family)
MSEGFDPREHAKNLLEEILKSLVDHPEKINVTYMVGERTTVYQVQCEKENLGQIIGSKGKHIDSLRTIMLAITARQGIRSIIEIPE